MSKPKKIEIKDRLQEVIANQRLLVADIAKYTGIPVSSIYDYIAGRNNPPIDRVLILAKYFNVSELWLLGYEVPMKDPLKQKEPPAKIYVVANALREDFILHTATTDKELAEVVYTQLKNRYIGTTYEDDLKILEFDSEHAHRFLSGHAQDVTEGSSRNDLAKTYPNNILYAMADLSPDTENIPKDNITDDIALGLEHALSTLMEREQEVLQLRYQKRKLLRDISEQWGCSVQNVNAIEQRALSKLLSPARLGYIQHGKRGYAKLLAQLEAQTAPTEHQSETPLIELNISSRSIKALSKKGYVSVADIYPLTKKEISLIRNIGPGAIIEIAQALESIGVCNTAWSELVQK